ncbi:MAG: hypothetical protein COA78_11875 [Blastopirellula sp.]|nr:MAG: hypothetical protein COA78_11875 [Blastopirellula sp.]
MSDNQFSDNPYQSPTELTQSTSVDESNSANPLIGPGTILLTISVLWTIIILFTLPDAFMILIQVDYSARGIAFFIGNISPAVILFCSAVFVLKGAISMLKKTNYRSAKIAAWISIIPVCSPFLVLGIPFGIWALVLLNRPEVKSLFKK